jgi:hypothetical protein
MNTSYVTIQESRFKVNTKMKNDSEAVMELRNNSKILELTKMCQFPKDSVLQGQNYQCGTILLDLK